MLSYRIVLLKNTKKNQYCTRWVGLPWLKPMMIFLLQQQHDVMSRVHTYAEHCLKGGLERGCFEDFSNILALLLTDWIDVVNLKLRLLGQLSFICNLAKAEQSPSNNALRLSTLFVHCSFAIAIDMSVSLRHGLIHTLYWNVNILQSEHNFPGLDCTSKGIIVVKMVKMKHPIIYVLHYVFNSVFDLSLTTATGDQHYYVVGKY
ncbi:hypothetical protein T03_14926 [Trichinella britovi]|uniref:Uncharacterized protein n=1 Tax=Trichinella britovi TaxID=45882 RepID=A0A0V1CWN3_TRIBR|nr:hypothetical protein T03_14926 [Trichinella britovi]